MSASSQYRKIAEVMKEKKVERRHAINERLKPKDDIREHIETAGGGIPSEASSSDSPVISRQEEKPKAVKKTTSTKKRRSSKRVLSDSKATKI